MFCYSHFICEYGRAVKCVFFAGKEFVPESKMRSVSTGQAAWERKGLWSGEAFVGWFCLVTAHRHRNTAPPCPYTWAESLFTHSPSSHSLCKHLINQPFHFVCCKTISPCPHWPLLLRSQISPFTECPHSNQIDSPPFTLMVFVQTLLHIKTPSMTTEGSGINSGVPARSAEVLV